MSDCLYSHQCLNVDAQCYRCREHNLLKLAQDKQKQKSRVVPTDNSKKSWRQLEQSSANKLSSVPTIADARRQFGSGNKWYAPGDIVDNILLLEAKERDQITTRGERYISIHKEWIEKIISEARGTGRYPGLVFRFKGDNNSYAIMEFDALCEMVHEIKLLREEIAILRARSES